MLTSKFLSRSGLGPRLPGPQALSRFYHSPHTATFAVKVFIPKGMQEVVSLKS